MLGIMVLSVVYDQEFEPIITFAFDAGRSITNVQEPLPEEMRLLLCLLEGAERRQNLLRRWSSQAPVPMTGDMSLVG
jgi:hypothetical protein